MWLLDRCESAVQAARAKSGKRKTAPRLSSRLRPVTFAARPTMALYHEAASILETVNNGKTSLKAEVFGKKGWKSDGKTLFALTSEAAKWSSILAEVVEKSGILKLEKQVCPQRIRSRNGLPAAFKTLF